MSDKKTLAIPNSGGNLNMKKKDQLTIKVSQTCQWCYSDPDHCFPSFLAPGQVNPGDYGPYIAENQGTVHYGCPKDPPCVPNGKIETGHTITVTG